MSAGEGELIAYARTSTDGQSEDSQLDDLAALRPARTFTDHGVSSGRALGDRPALERALDYARDGDTIVVWKLDRLARSTREALNVAGDLHDRGIGLRILTGTLAGSYQPHGEGKFFFVIAAAFGELERDHIRERTRAGLRAARARGRVGGRPRALDPGQREQVRDLFAMRDGSGALKYTAREIASQFHCSVPVIYRCVRGE